MRLQPSFEGGSFLHPTKGHPSDYLVDSYQVADNTFKNEDGEKVVDLGDGMYNLDRDEGYRNLPPEEEEYLSRILPIDPDRPGSLQVRAEKDNLYLQRNGDRIDITGDPDFNFGYFFPEFESIAGGTTRKPWEDESGIGTKAGIALLSLGILGAGVAGFSFMDQDHDGTPNYKEWAGPTSWRNPDTNGDGIEDGLAVGLGLDPTEKHPAVADALDLGLGENTAIKFKNLDQQKSRKQIKFLQGLDENIEELAEKGKICDFNWDDDYATNYFEDGIKNITDAETHNDRWVLLLNFYWNSIGSNSPDIKYNAQHSFFHEDMGVPENHIIDLRHKPEGWEGWRAENYKPPTPSNFEDSIEKISEASDENDLVYTIFGSHGWAGGIDLSDGDSLKFPQMKKYLDQIPCKAQYVQIGACHSGGAIDGPNDLQNSEISRVTVTDARADETSGSFDLIDSIYPAVKSEKITVIDTRVNFHEVLPTSPDRDNNHYVSVAEAFQSAKDTYFAGGDPQVSDVPPLHNPQISDPYDIAEKLYFGEYRVED